jgi:IS30 family transposase
MVIQALVRRGVYVCDIAPQLGVHPKTVSRALAPGGVIAPLGNQASPLDK